MSRAAGLVSDISDSGILSSGDKSNPGQPNHKPTGSQSTDAVFKLVFKIISFDHVSKAHWKGL